MLKGSPGVYSVTTFVVWDRLELSTGFAAELSRFMKHLHGTAVVLGALWGAVGGVLLIAMAQENQLF